jgi:hypothetical protein
MEGEAQPAMVVILTCAYRAKCDAPGCDNVARAIVRYNDAGGRPLGQEENCIVHTTGAKKTAVADGSRFMKTGRSESSGATAFSATC